MRLEGKVAIVTGAASGIGQATAQLFAREGAHVLAVDRPGSPLEQAHAGYAAIQTLERDVAEDAAAERVVAAVVTRFGGLDILMNNAGTSQSILAESFPTEEWDRTLSVNLRAVFLLCRQAIPEFKARGGGRIINTASVMAQRTDYGLAAYCASKAGVAGLTRTLALELGKYNITANWIEPGAIYTGMTRQNFDNPTIRAVWEKKSPLRRLGQPLDIARGALFLASEDAAFVTGQGLVIDGGLLLRT
jgi:NAD(P)-dependent dehydrogenase (short-subunit alcohol dehydrogenase family)